jgi:hypothetical protein
MAVADVYRRQRDGRRVVAVASAFEGVRGAPRVRHEFTVGGQVNVR